MSITPEVEHHEIDESEDTCLPKSCEVEDEPITLEYDDDIFSIEYKSFSHGLDDDEGLNVGFYVEYESFSFDPPLLTIFLSLLSLPLLSLRQLSLRI